MAKSEIENDFAALLNEARDSHGRFATGSSSGHEPDLSSDIATSGKKAYALIEDSGEGKPKLHGLFATAEERDAAHAKLVAAQDEDEDKGDSADLESHDIDIEGEHNPGDKVHIVHSGGERQDEKGNAVGPFAGDIHGAFTDKHAANAAQFAQAEENWAQHGQEYDFLSEDENERPSAKDWDRAASAWNEVHPSDPAPMHDGNGNIPAGFEAFGTAMMGKTGAKLKFPGVKAANEHFESSGDAHHAVYLTSARLGMKKSSDTGALRKLFSGLAGLFGKDSPGATDVHVDVPLGDDSKPTPRKKRKPNPGATLKFSKATVAKVDSKLGLVFGYAMVCKENGEPYFDVQGDHIDESAMLEALADFAENSRVAKEMHAGDERGAVVFSFPMTTDIAAALNIKVEKTGALIAMKPDAAMLARFESGELSGFSIGGSRITDEDVE
jgi:hypothetical protein